MFKVFLCSASERFEVSASQVSSSPVLVPEGGLEPLVGQVSRADVSVPSRPGALLGVRRYGVISADVPFYLHAVDGEQMDGLYRRFRRMWSEPVWFEVDVGGGRWFLDVELGQHLKGVAVNPARRTHLNVTVTLIAPTGLFRSHTYRMGSKVIISNTGDAIVFPRVRYSGGGGRVIAPSGAAFTLPPAGKDTVVELSPNLNRLSGIPNEGVPPGSSAEWFVPDGAKMEWELLVADPWA